MSNWTLPITTTTIFPWTPDIVETCGGTPHTLTTPTTKGVITDTECSRAYVLRTPRDVSKTSRDGNTARDGDVVVRSPWDNRPILIGGIVAPPTIRNSGSQDIIKKRQSISPSVGGNSQNFDACVDGNLTDDGDSAAIFSKVLGRELSNRLITYIYSRCRLDFMSNAVVTKAPYFVHMGLLSLNASDVFNAFGTPDTKVRQPTDVSHCSLPDHVFGEVTAVAMSGTRS